MPSRRGRDYTGPSWQQPSWYLRYVDRHHHLGHHERVEAAIEACRRTRALVDSHPGADPYDLARQVTADIRHEHHAEHREPIPAPPPIDLDAIGGRRDPKDVAARSGPHATDPNSGVGYG